MHSTYTDFSRAFDIENHKILFFKLSCLSVPKSLARWFASYHSIRCCRVSVDGYRFRSFFLSTGVPQVSILAPLFLYFLSVTCPPPLACLCLFFSNDLKLLSITSPMNSVSITIKSSLALIVGKYSPSFAGVLPDVLPAQIIAHFLLFLS